MKDIQDEFNELLLELILTTYFDKNDKNLKHIVNIDTVEAVIKDFLDYFRSYDNEHNTSHIATIEQMFVTRQLNRYTCENLGYSKRTFYRYRKKYLQIFEAFLRRNLETLDKK